MLGVRALLLATISAAAAGAPADPSEELTEDAFPTEGTRYQSRLLPPGATDARLGAVSDVLLSTTGGVLALDRGVAALGPGALGLGLELGAARCLLACGRIGQDLVIERLLLSPAARVTYHLAVGGTAPNLAATGFYALLAGGAAFSFVDEQEATGRARATTYSPFLSAGLGTVYFPGNSDEVFAGGEARLTYMPRFSVLQVDPPQALLPPQSVSPLGGVSLTFFMGVRL